MFSSSRDVFTCRVLPKAFSVHLEAFLQRIPQQPCYMRSPCADEANKSSSLLIYFADTALLKAGKIVFIKKKGGINLNKILRDSFPTARFIYRGK